MYLAKDSNTNIGPVFGDQAFLIYIYHAEKVCFECLNVPFIWLFGDTKVEWETLDLATPPTPPGLMTS